MATTPILGAGSEVGPYRIEALLGQGGMGVVYRARDPRLDRPVALKVLSPELSDDRRFRARFERESRLAASIDHGGIVPVYEAGDVDGLLYIAMRYVDGRDLAELLREEGPLGPDRVLDLVSQLAGALDAAHEQGLIHRDVKPSNALVAREGHVYLADFGLTKASGRDTTTATGQVAGTVAYMAPEVVRGEEPTVASDLYALGCVLYECLIGEVPFPGPNAAAVIYGHLELPPPSVSHLPVLDPVIARALAKDPAQRFASGAELIAAARTALAGGRRRTRRPARPLVGAAVAAAVAALAAIAMWPEGGGRIAAIETDALALIDPEEESLRARTELDGPPSDVAVGPDAMWVAGDRDGTVSRVDPETRTLRQTVTVGRGPSALAAERGGVWAANLQEGTISHVSAATNTVTDKIGAGRPSDVCLLDGDLWVPGAAAGTILRIDPGTHRRRTIALGATTTSVACGEGLVWTVGESGRLIGVSPSTNSVLRDVDIGAGAGAVAAGEGAVWVANPRNGTVTRVDPKRGVVTGTVALGTSAEPVALVTGGGTVWVANRHARTLVGIDPVRAVVKQNLALGNEPRALAMAGGQVWTAVAATGAGHRGGTLRIALNERIAPIERDPATSYANGGMFLSLVHDGLTAVRRTGGSAGTQVVPDLAQSLPGPADGGKTYTFALRPGVRFSTGDTVRPSDVKRGIERSLNAFPGAFGLLEGIKSVAADDVSGTVVIRLRRPDPDFLYRLSLPFAAAVPPGVGKPSKIVPGTGPYRFVTFGRNRVRLERNPYYRTWSPLAKPDGYPDVIEARLGMKTDEVIEAVRTGKADWSHLDVSSARAVAELRRRSPGLVRDSVPLQSTWVFLNTQVPPFDKLDARRAVALAVDRRAAVAAVGGAHVARATCHILPPSSAGYRPDCPSRDLQEARRLVRRSGTRGATVTLWSGRPLFTSLNPVITDALRAIGYRVRVRNLEVGDYFHGVADPANRAQIGAVGWVADYPSDSTFLSAQFTCDALRRDPYANTNYSRYCDRRTETLMRRAGQAQSSDPTTADALWAKAERRVLDAGAAVPLYNPISTDIVSERVRNDQQNPQWGFLPDQAWVR